MSSVLKSFLAPFFDRIEGRFRHSFEVLGLHAAIVRTDQRMPVLEQALRSIDRQLQTLVSLQSLLEARVASAQSVLDLHGASIAELQTTMTTLRKHAETGEKMRLWLAPMEARLHDLQESLRGVRSTLGRADAHAGAVEDHALHLLMRQIIRLADGFSAVRTPHGWIVVPEEEYRSLIHLADGRSYHEVWTLGAMTALLRRGDLVLDVGAHIGLLTMPLARSVGPTGRVIAVEPMARSVEALRRTASLNLIEQIEVHQVAASDQTGPAAMFEGTNSMMASLFSQAAEESTGRRIEVERVRLDDLVPRETPVALVKLDVEGAELLALAGMASIISRSPEIAVVAEFGPSHLERTGISVDDWFATFAAQGLMPICTIDETTGECIPGRHADHESANVLFSRPENPRLRSLPLQQSEQ